jgi:hypothetical protein
MLCFDTTIYLQNESEDKVITNDDVLGDEVPYDQQEALRVLCYRLLEMPLVSRLFLLLPNILCINFVYALQ